jgi:hypothetical protein
MNYVRHMLKLMRLIELIHAEIHSNNNYLENKRVREGEREREKKCGKSKPLS